MEMEICIDSIEAAKRAISGGATRLEICSALSEGGLTPSPGLVRFIKNYSTIKVVAMIRIKSDNFIYTPDEMSAMLYDLEILHNLGVDGFVFGALNADNSIDLSACRAIINAARPKHVTFHRAFDETKNPHEALEQLIDLGFQRILTSGQRKSADEGLDLIARLIVQATNRIIIMPGSGITPENILLIKRVSGAKEFHASAKKKNITNNQSMVSTVNVTNQHQDFVYASEELIKKMVHIINSN